MTGERSAIDSLQATSASQGCSSTGTELAFVVLDGADVWLGEPFSADRYAPGRRAEGERLSRLAVVARLFNARGVLLATAVPALASVTAEAAQRRLAGPAGRLELRPAVVALRRPAKPIDAAAE